MECKKFYFVSDKYFSDFPDIHLELNKERDEHGKPHRRPFYFAIQDNLNPDIYWFIPISRQTEKYQVHYNKKVDKYGKCDTIYFGYVLGTHATFLIQNMCPVTSEYVEEIYIDKATNAPVYVKEQTAQEVERKARKVLNLYRKGKPLIFPNVALIEEQLNQKLIASNTTRERW